MNTPDQIHDITKANIEGRDLGLSDSHLTTEDVLAAAKAQYPTQNEWDAYTQGFEWGARIFQVAIARDAQAPLDELVAARRALADANYAVLRPGKDDDELVSVADHITQLVTSLRQAHADLEAAQLATAGVQPIEDICKACLAGYHQGAILNPSIDTCDATEAMMKGYVNSELAAAFRIGKEAGTKDAADAEAAKADLRLIINDSFRRDGQQVEEVAKASQAEEITHLKALLTAVRVKRTRGSAHKFITLGSSDAAAREAIYNASCVLDAAGVPREIEPGVEAPYHIAQRIQALLALVDAALAAAGPQKELAQ